MKLIRAFTVTDAALTSTNVYEAVPTAYAGGTTYADGDIASVAGSNGAHTVYESLQNGNTGNTPASSPLWWKAKGTVYNAYSSNHALNEIVTDTTNHRLYKSLSGANSNALPAEDSNGNPTSDANWTFQGPSNRWAPFDGKSGTVATWDGTVTYTIDVTGRMDTLQLLNLTGSSVNVTMLDVDAVEIHNEDYSLVSSEGIDGWYSWLYDPIVYVKDLAIEGLPIDYNPTLTFTITGTGDVSVGTANPGFAREIGSTQYGAGAGINDYSRIDADDFGVRSITQRDYVKNMSLEVWVDTANTDFAFNLLADYRATPVGVVGSSSFGSLNQYGLLKDWRVRITYVSHSILDVDFEGL